jgi:hypothetical protein
MLLIAHKKNRSSGSYWNDRFFVFFQELFPLSAAIFLFLKKKQKGFSLQSGLG